MDGSEEIVDNPDHGVAEHIREYVATDGRRGQWLRGWKAPTLLLVTRGRRSGKLRRTALAYGEDEGRATSSRRRTAAPSGTLIGTRTSSRIPRLRCRSETTGSWRGRATRRLTRDRRCGS